MVTLDVSGVRELQGRRPDVVTYIAMLAVACLVGLPLACQAGILDEQISQYNDHFPDYYFSSNRQGSSYEVDLVHHLLKVYERYGTIARPLFNASEKITVYFGMRLIKLDLFEKEQTMKTSVWVRCRWQDQYLKWDPEQFGGLKQVVLPWSKVWTPDIELVNTADTDVNIRHADIMVRYQGLVFWAPHRVFTSACLIDVTNFPYDTHRCDMWFQAMSRYTTQMDLKPYNISPWDLETYLESFKEAHTWGVMGNSSERFASSRSVGTVLKFSRRVSLRFSLTVSRRSGYTGVLLMVPCVLLGSTTVVIFCLPPDRPDRITLAMSLLASFLVLLLILVETAPPSAAAIPTLGIYYACIMLLIMASPFLSGLVVNISHRGEYRKPPGRFAQVVFLEVLSWPLFLHDRFLHIQRLLNERHVNGLDRHHVTENGCETGASPEVTEEATTSQEVEDPSSDDQTSQQQQDNEHLALTRRISRIENGLLRFLRRGQHRRRSRYYRRLSDPVHLQWKLLSEVLDRICFSLYIIVLILSFIFFFPRK